jgi:pyrimidine deaminase RibD-like protein
LTKPLRGGNASKSAAEGVASRIAVGQQAPESDSFLNFDSLMASEQTHPHIAAGNHEGYMEYALEQARHSPPAPTKFCVGAVLVDADKNKILSSGWSLELPDNNPADPGKTHAEQCCFIKVAQKYNLPEERLCEVLPQNTILYTTIWRILGLKDCIKTVYMGIMEPENFIDQSVLVIGRQRLQDAGVEVVFIQGMEDRFMKVSLAGH